MTPKEQYEARKAHLEHVAREAARQLEGTCQSLCNVLEGMDEDGADDDMAFCAEFDRLVFECTRCNWWHSQDQCTEDSSGQWICMECKAEEDEET